MLAAELHTQPNNEVLLRLFWEVGQYYGLQAGSCTFSEYFSIIIRAAFWGQCWHVHKYKVEFMTQGFDPKSYFELYCHLFSR